MWTHSAHQYEWKGRLYGSGHAREEAGTLSIKKASSEAPTNKTSRNTNKTSTKQSAPGDKKPNNQKPKTNTKDGPSKNQMRKDRLCFTCKNQGHIAKDCPQNEKLENNSIRIVLNTKVD